MNMDCTRLLCVPICLKQKSLNHGKVIKNGLLSGIKSLHRQTIDRRVLQKRLKSITINNYIIVFKCIHFLAFEMGAFLCLSFFLWCCF